MTRLTLVALLGLLASLAGHSAARGVATPALTEQEVRLVAEIRTAIDGRTGRDLNVAALQAVHRDLDAGRPRMFRTFRGTEIDAVYDELLLKHLGVPTRLLTRPDRDVRDFTTYYNRWMRQLLAARHGRTRLVAIGEEAARLAAERDIKAGRLRLWLFGMPGPADEAYRRLLEERFDIEVRLGGCILPERFDVEPYNERMRTEIERRFGAGILERMQQEARRQWEEQGALQCLTAEEDAAVNASDE